MYNNPYFYNPAMIPRSAGLFSGIRNINWANMLTNTQKTLGIINQAIPIAYQIKPIVNNAKTMFKVMGAINSDDTTSTTTANNTNTENTPKNENMPLFFI